MVEDDWKVYQVVTCAELLRAAGLGHAPGIAISERPWLGPIDVSIPSISFGQVSKPDFPITEYPPDNWNEPSYSIHGGCWTIEKATIHGELGIVTVGDFLVRESLYLAVPEFHGFVWLDANHLRMFAPEPEIHVSDAVHALCGYVGNRNYAHWWVNIVSVIGTYVQDRLFGDATLVLPNIRKAYQTQTLALIPEIEGKIVYVPEKARVFCDRLQIIPRLTASDYTPSPGRMDFIRELKKRVRANSSRSRKVYISRRDAGARSLINEAEVSDLVAEFGFEILTMTGLELADQIRLLAETKQLIAPHGAGLANLLFCQPGAVVLELHYDNKVQWSLRRLASVVPVTYGCLVGRQIERQPGQSDEEYSNAPWSLPLGELRAVLTRPPFSPSL